MQKQQIKQAYQTSLESWRTPSTGSALKRFLRRLKQKMYKVLREITEKMCYFEKYCIHWKAAKDFGLLDYLDDKQKFGIQLAILSSLKVVSEDFISPSQRNSYPKNISNLISWPPYITLLLISLMLFEFNLKAFNGNMFIFVRYFENWRLAFIETGYRQVLKMIFL